MRYKLKTALMIHEREDLAADPNTPEETLLKLAKDPEKSVRAYLAAYNDNLPISVLGILAYDRDESIRKLIAQRKDTPAWVLEELLLNATPDIEGFILRNPNLNYSVLESIWIGMNSEDILDWIGKADTPIQVLETIIAESDVKNYVWKAIYHPQLPDSILLDIMEDSQKKPIREQAAFRIFTDMLASKDTINKACQIVLDGDFSNPVKSVAMSNKKVEPEFLIKFLNGPGSVQLRQAIISNPRIPSQLIKDNITSETDPNIILGIIKNPKLSEDENLAEEVFDLIVENFNGELFFDDLMKAPWMTAENKYYLMDGVKGLNYVADYIKKIKNQDEIRDFYKLKNIRTVVVGIARNPNTPEDIYEELFNFPEIYNILASLSRNSLEQLETIYEYARVKQNDKLLLKLAAQKNISPELLEGISRITNDSEIVAKIISNTNTSIETLKHLIPYHIKNKPVLFYAYHRTDLTPELYEKLYKAPGVDYFDVKNLIENTATPLSILLDIANNPDWNTQIEIRKALLANPRIPEEEKGQLIEAYKQSLAEKINTNQEKIPRIDYTKKRDVSPKHNTDLELLQRLRSYLKHV